MNGKHGPAEERESVQVTGHGSKIKRKMEQAIAALLRCNSTDEAADAIGVAKSTLLRWMKQPEFDAAYLQARREVIFQSGARLQQACNAAVTTLLKVMADGKTPAATRVRAAQLVLEQAHQILEIEDLSNRVAALERRSDTGNSMKND